ncbi:hypothetical protein ACFY0G_35080 [Streptomyces sp. NPDC001552]|uniref:hypothetical protein n=1 Tax=Streptomyces sp. NPDC001552 TaxID=3364587 RepID=UPI00369FD026
MRRDAGTRHKDPCNCWSGMTSGRVHVVHAPGDRPTITKEPYMARVAGPVAELSRADFAHAGQGS